jgi:hypothetical protein
LIPAASPFPPELRQDSLLQKPQRFHSIVAAADLFDLGSIFLVNYEKLLARAHLLVYPLAMTSTTSRTASICSLVLKYPMLKRTAP